MYNVRHVGLGLLYYNRDRILYNKACSTQNQMLVLSIEKL